MVVSAKKLIQGSVIYMKKMRMSKRGFTLTEIIIVVAIMVIVASAAFVGIAVVLDKAKRSRDDLKNTHGRDEDGKELFEAEAWEEIDELTKDAANFFDVSLYKPANPTNTPTPSPSPTPVPADDNPGGGTNTPTPKSTNTPTPPPTNTPVPATSTPIPQGGGTPKTVNGSSTDTSLGKGYQGSTVITGDGRGIKKITITAPEGVRIAEISDGSNSGLYTVNVSGDNKTVTVTFTANWGPSPKTSVNLNYIKWVGSQDLNCTYDISY